MARLTPIISKPIPTKPIPTNTTPPVSPSDKIRVDDDVWEPEAREDTAVEGVLHCKHTETVILSTLLKGRAEVLLPSKAIVEHMGCFSEVCASCGKTMRLLGMNKVRGTDVVWIGPSIGKGGEIPWPVLRAFESPMGEARRGEARLG